jgi:hypothetical protein
MQQQQQQKILGHEKSQKTRDPKIQDYPVDFPVCWQNPKNREKSC